MSAPALNPRQRQAAEDFSRNLLLLAGAGTGKTLTLAVRVANLLTSKTAKPEEILCLTFTNRACREMAERIESIAGPAARAVNVRTIHSFCAWLLRQSPPPALDVGRDFTVCDAEDALDLVREVVFEVTGREIGDRAAGILQQFLGAVKDCQLARPGLSPDGATAHLFVEERARLERICVDEQRRFDPKFFAFLAKYGASILRMYNLKLRSNNTLDFSDLLLLAGEALTAPETAALWRDRYRFVQVDEVQDVSLAEYRLLSGLWGNAVTLLCGDFNQTIYQWRGSDPAGLTDRYLRERRAAAIELTENYRSSPGLLAVAQNFLRSAFGRGQGGGCPLSDCGEVESAGFDTARQEIAWVRGRIAALPTQDYSRVAVITRTNRACAEVCDLLKELRLTDGDSPVRFMLADELRLFKRAEVKDLLACLGLLCNPGDGENLKRVAVRLTEGVGQATVNGVLSHYREGTGVALTDLADLRTHANGDYFEPLLAALDAGRVVVFDVESTGTDVWTDDIVQMAAVRLGPDGRPSARFERFLRPGRPVGGSEAVHGFSDAFLAERGEDPAAALEAFLDFTEGTVIVGHNVGFDMAITAQNLLRRGIARPLGNLWYDTLDLSRRFLKKLPDHKLATVAAALGAEHAPSHDAMDDILATADALILLCERWLRPGAGARRACYKKYLPRFGPLARQLAGLRKQAEGLDAPGAADLMERAFRLRDRCATQEQRANLLLFSDFVRDCADPNKPLRQQLGELLELSALSRSELDRLIRSANKVAVITAHQAKGCEFDYVFLPMLQEGVFPTFQAIRSGDLEEEKRVFYVSITRAKKRLFLSWSRYSADCYPEKPSRFLSML